MEDVTIWLCEHDLGDYCHKFEEHGWDELSLLAEMSDVQLEKCIKKEGHRAKFRKALRKLTSASVISGVSANPSPVSSLTEIPWEFGAVSRKGTDHASHSHTPITETTASLDGVVLMGTIQKVDRTTSIEPYLEVDRIYSKDTAQRVGGKTSMCADQEIDGEKLIVTVRVVDGTESREAVREADSVDSTGTNRVVKGTTPIRVNQEIDRKGLIDTPRLVDGTESMDSIQKGDSTALIQTVQEAKDISEFLEDNIEENYTFTTSSTHAYNEESGFDEARMKPYTNCDLSLSSELVGRSYAVIDNIEGSASHLMNRGPTNVTIIEHSETTTVNQGPAEAVETNSPVVILRDQMQMVADSYRSKDHLFVETEAFTELKSAVEEMHWGTLLGKPGDGKSATAAHLLLQYSKSGYEPLFLSSPRDWKKLISGSPSSRQIVVIDDMFGQSYLDDSKNVGEWKSLMGDMSRIVKQRKGNLLIICTSRRYIFKDIESALDKFDRFSNHSIVDMTDEKFKLSGQEKVAIFKKFTDTYTIVEPEPVISTIGSVDPPHGFPHCVELYCSNAFLRQQGIAFFENPVQYVQREISNFRDNDRVKFLVLLLVLHKDEKLGIDGLDKLIEKTTDDDMNFFQTAGVSLETAIPDIHRALKGLTNTYLKQNKDGSYSFSHHSLKETLAFIYISVNPSHAIWVLDLKHIVAYTRLQKETAKHTVPKVCLPFKPLAKRMISEIKHGHASTVSDCEVWSDKMFVSKWLKRIENKQLTFLEAIFCSLMIGLIRKERYDAATTLLKSESIWKTLLNSDLWVKNLQTGLKIACADHEPNIDLIRALVSPRCGENRLKLDGSELLSKMLQHSNAVVAIVLIEHTSITAQDSQNMHGLYQYFHLLACSKIDMPQFEVLCKKLQQAGFDINQTDGNDVPAVFKCLTRFEDKDDINHTDGNDVPAVFKCLTRFEDEVWNRLLCMVNAGANIHKHCKHGNIVMFAVNKIDLHISYTLCNKILSKLTELKVDFCCTDSMGSNALHIICQTHPDEGSHTLIEYLLEMGVKSEAVNTKTGTVPLILALKNDFGIDTIQLLAKNTPPKHVDKFGQGYFHYLLSSGFTTNTDEFCDKCELLMKLGSSINGKDDFGKPPIVHLMERHNHIRCSFIKLFRFFREHGMDLHVKDDRGRNVVLYVLNCLSKRELLPLLHYFHSIGLDLKVSDNNGQNALHYLFSKAFYNEKLLEEDVSSEYVLQLTEREFLESSGKNAEGNIYFSNRYYWSTPDNRR